MPYQLGFRAIAPVSTLHVEGFHVGVCETFWWFPPLKIQLVEFPLASNDTNPALGDSCTVIHFQQKRVGPKRKPPHF